VIRLVLTILLCSRAIRAWKVPSYDSITTPGTAGEGIITDIRLVTPLLLRRMKLSKSDRITWSRHPVMTARGPMGMAVWTALNCIPLIMADSA